MTAALTAPEKALRYPSLEAMRVTHRDLFKRFQRADAPQALVAEITEFLLRGEETGAVLGDERARDEAQSLLDYWVAALYRLRFDPPDAVLVAFNPGDAPPLPEDAPCPYKGLTPFAESDARSFYGRQVFIDELCNRYRVSPLVVISGPSGSGKTSLVQAGLIPALKSGAVPGSDKWHFFRAVVPGADPLRSLAQAVLADADAPTLAAEIDRLRKQPDYLSRMVKDVGPALLVIDQFDELFTDQNQPVSADARALIDNLVSLMQQPVNECRLVLIWADSASGPTDETTDSSDGAAPGAGAFLLDAAYRADVPDLGTRELRDAILQPTELIGMQFQDPDAMVGDLVRALIGVPVVAPLLQFVLLQLWDRRKNGIITWEAYNAVLHDPQRRRTNVGWALNTVAERTYEAAADTPGLQEAIKKLVLQLVEVQLGADTRLRRLRRDSLCRSGDDCALVEEAFRRLEAARLVRFIEDPADAGASVEVEMVHAALARYWKRLDEWLLDVLREQALSVRLNDAAREWRRLGRPLDALWGQSQLDQVSAIRDRTPEQEEFVAASEEYLRRLARLARRARRLKFFGVTSLIVLSLLLAVVGFVAALNYRRAADNYEVAAANNLVAEKRAENEVVLQHQVAMQAVSGKLVAESRNYTDSRPDLALLLGLQAYHIDQMPGARAAVLNLLERYLQLHTLLATPGPVSNVAVSPDGAVIGAAYRDTVIVWDAHTLGELIQVRASAKPEREAPPVVKSFAFSADHQRLAMSLGDNTIEVFDLTGEQPAPPPITEQQALVGLAFHADGEQLTVFGAGGVLADRDLNNPDRSNEMSISSPGVGGVVFSPDGSQLAIFGCAPFKDDTCDRGQVQVFDAAHGNQIWQSGAEVTSRIKAAAFSADGARLAIGEASGDFGLYDADHKLSLLGSLKHAVTGIAYNLNASQVAVGDCVVDAPSNVPCPASDITIFDVASKTATGPTIAGQPGEASSLAFLPDGTLVAAGRGSAVAIWDSAAVRQEKDYVAPVVANAPIRALLPGDRVAVASCSQLLATGCVESRINLLDLYSGKAVAAPLSLKVGVTSLAADGELLAVGGADGHIYIWDKLVGDPASSVGVPVQLPSQSNSLPPVQALAFGSNGWLAANGEFGEVVLWKMVGATPSEDPIRLRTVGRQSVVKAAFSPDGSRLAAGSQDGSVVLWDPSKPQVDGVPLMAHTGRITGMAFSPDGLLLATASTDSTLIVWDATAGTQIGAPLKAGPVTSVAFDAATGALTSSSGSMRTIWGPGFTSWDAMEARACQLAHRGLLETELTSFAIPDDAEPVCSGSSY